ncbi:hypothetical protein BV25DRAFT_1875205 [Artomyces pyxidatus]|uniref:Uncharacterized protein n=1 Tax=Artomyces pyxidatus TaxID=48021 RepID=A0ACB8TI43_9AGAM|nr:hypothetical protein BV25DRAFT_1875205 [Artomyces pyxidatus]
MFTYQPFPLNPSFKPPPPLSDDERTLIYTLYMSNPEENSVRALSTRFHISIKRLDAILRLKGLEEHWVKGKPLQTGFRHGMEKLLNVADKLTSPEDWVYSRMDAVKADMLDQVEGDDPARARYQRMFWEPVVEGQEPVAPKALQQARDDAVRHARDNESAKSADDLLGHHHDRQSATEVWSESEGILKRPPIKFVDVGGKFLDPKDRIRRMKESERRKRIRAKKAASVVALSS